MTRLSAPPRYSRRRGLRRTVASFAATIGLAVAVLGSVLVPAGAASASLGSVPAEVTAYVSSGAMVGRLNDVYGPNASGTKGIKFDDTTKAGPISRVYEWTAERLANHATDHPVQLTNNWVVPITIGGKSVGLATIWINPQTVDAELASFDPSAGLGSALTTVPATAALVHDSTTGAWLALADGKVTALVAGTSGITGSVPVSSLKLSPTAPAPIATTEPNTGLALAIGIVALIVIIIVVALLLPRGRRAKTKSQDSGSQDAAAAPIADEKVAEPEPAPEPAAAPAPAAATATAAASPSKPAARKPAGARPSGRTPTTSTAAKPATSKPPVSRPAASKPPATKPPAPKQPPRPRAPKPPAESTGSDS